MKDKRFFVEMTGYSNSIGYDSRAVYDTDDVENGGYPDFECPMTREEAEATLEVLETYSKQKGYPMGFQITDFGVEEDEEDEQ